MKTDDLRSACERARELKGSADGMKYLGLVLEVKKIWMDDNDELWYSSHYVGD